MKVAVLGGGITGVAVAKELLARGYDPHVFEAESRIGGLCRSDVHDGFVHDLSGGHIIHSRDQPILRQMVDILGPGGAVETIRNTKIFYRGRYVKYPFENGLGDLPVNDNYACIKGYIDAFMARKGGAKEPTNFRDWILWRMGDGIADSFMYPYNEKLWSSDLRDVSTRWVSGRVPEAPYEDVLRSALGIATEGYTHQSKFYYPRTGGFETMVQRLAEPILDRVRVNTRVASVELGDGRGVAINGERFDAVVNSIPLQTFYRALSPRAPDDVRAAVEGLRYLSIATVLIGIDEPNLSEHSWVYLPHPENGPVNRLTYLANYSPDNAPAGKSSILAEVTFPGVGHVPEAGPSLEREVVDSLANNGMFKPDRVSLVRSAAFQYAYPYYDVGFEARMKVVTDHLDRIGVHSLGRFGAYKYVNSDQVLILVREFFASHFPKIG